MSSIYQHNFVNMNKINKNNNFRQKQMNWQYNID